MQLHKMTIQLSATPPPPPPPLVPLCRCVCVCVSVCLTLMRHRCLQYNGCLWKGQKLRVEKARSHYTERLQKEWLADQQQEESQQDAERPKVSLAWFTSSPSTLTIPSMPSPV